MEVRLQKFLADAGVASRRKAEELILAGKVSVNGTVVTTLGTKVDDKTDEVSYNGKKVVPNTHFVYVMLHKPEGYVTTVKDQFDRPTVMDLVKKIPERIVPVGRLDYDSEGLLLLTNDGELTFALTHPSHEVEKEYEVEATGDWAKALPVLQGPMELDGVPLSPAKVKWMGQDGKRSCFSIVIHEGRNRQVRRMCAIAGLNVVRLRRVREGSLRLDHQLKPGQWRDLTESEIALLKE